MTAANYKELDNDTSVTGTNFKATDNESYKNERAHKVTRSISSKYNCDNSITVTMKDGYENILGEETFTKEDLYFLAQDKAEKIINKKIKDKRRTERNKGIDDTLEEVCKMIGLSVLSIAGCMLLDAAGKKSIKAIKGLARKIAK